MLINWEEQYKGQKLSYEVVDEGYDIYLSGKKWIVQHEPYIPYPDLGYEGSCKKQIEDLFKGEKEVESELSGTEQRLSALEEENANLSATLDDILTNIIPAMATGTEESEVK